MSNKRRASDNGPRKYLQWVPIALVVFGVIGSWFTLNERVNAGETSMERNEKMDDQQQQFILEHERRIQEGETRRAVLQQRVKIFADDIAEVKTDVKEILKELRRSNR